MIRFAFAVAALAAASSAFAGDGFNGLQLVPRFDRDDALVIEVSNWTKLTVTLDQVDVRLPGSTSKACRFSVKKTLVLEPTIKHDIVVAPARAARECLRTRPGLERASARELAMTHVERDATATGERMALAASVQFRDRRRQASSEWVVGLKQREE